MVCPMFSLLTFGSILLHSHSLRKCNTLILSYRPNVSAIDAPSKPCIINEDLTTDAVKVKLAICNIVLVAACLNVSDH